MITIYLQFLPSSGVKPQIPEDCRFKFQKFQYPACMAPEHVHTWHKTTSKLFAQYQLIPIANHNITCISLHQVSHKTMKFTIFTHHKFNKGCIQAPIKLQIILYKTYNISYVVPEKLDQQKQISTEQLTQ